MGGHRDQRAFPTFLELATLVGLGVSYWLVIHPQVRGELAGWQKVAERIPDPVLRAQALEKLTGERLNPEAAAFFAVLAPRRLRRKVVRLMVAYQLLYDYLDALNELPGASELRNGLQLHRVLTDALLPDRPLADYYRYSPFHWDGGYLQRLASTCRRIVAELPSARAIGQVLIHASERCGEAQSHNHAMVSRDISSFVKWSGRQSGGDGYLWWELAAGGISCLGIHALLALAAGCHSTFAEAQEVDHAYFPPVCALSALLDSLADYHRDAGTTNHSFIGHYCDTEHAARRLVAIAQDGATRVCALRYPRRHAVILAGITSFYLSSPSVQDGFPALPARTLAQRVHPIAAPMRAVMRARRKLHRRSYSTNSPSAEHFAPALF
jgi:tetraprenyl-beta-curcumene synthase